MASAADSRPKCPFCQSRVSDAAARDPGPRQVVNYVPNPAYSNPKRAARAALLRANNSNKRSK